MTVIIVSVFTFGAFSLYSGELVAPRHLPTELRVITLMGNISVSFIFLTLAVRGIYPDPNDP